MKARLALATLALVAACGSDSASPGTTASFAGTWYLATINGFQLPVDVQTDSGKFNIRDAVLTTTESGSWSETPTGYAVVGGGALQTRVRSRAGTWTRGGATVTLRTTAGTTAYQGTIAGTQFKLIEPVTGFPFVFVRAIPNQ